MKLMREKLTEQGENADDPDVLEGDWARGLIWVAGKKVVTPAGDQDTLVVSEAEWESAQVPVDKASFLSAVN